MKLVKCTINFTDFVSLHPETLFWLCKTMGEIQAPHKSHKTKELVSRLCFSLCLGSKSDQSCGSDFNLQILLQWPGLSVSEGKELNTLQKHCKTQSDMPYDIFFPRTLSALLSLSLTHTNSWTLTEKVKGTHTVVEEVVQSYTQVKQNNTIIYMF